MQGTAVYVSTLVLGAGVLLVLAAVTVRRDRSPTMRTLTATLVAIAAWLAAETASIVAGTTAATAGWNLVTYVAAATSLALLFAFVVRYTGHGAWLTRRREALLAVEPALVAVLALTAAHHDLLVADVTPSDRMSGVDVAFGPAMGVHLAYAWLLSVGAILLLFRFVVRSDSLYAGQGGLLAVAGVAPLVGNLVDNFAPLPFDLTEPGFLVTGLTIAVAVVAYDFTDLSPVARSAVVETVEDGVLVVDADGRVVDANRSARDLLALDDSPVGDTLDDALAAHPDLRAAVAGTATPDGYVAVDAPDGPRFLDVQTSSLTADAHGQRGQVVLLHDSTDQRRRQRALERQNDRLEEFASLVSHDLRNPLNVADGYVDLVAETGDLAHLDEIRESHRRMDALIEDVLTLARQGHRDLDREPLDLAAVADTAWSHVDTGDATFANDLHGTVHADRSTCLRLFENLLRNAVEHGGDGVHVTCDLVERDGDPVGFAVADDGPGIPADDRDRVFESGHSTSDSGTGLGLSIVADAADAHDWTVAVTESASGGARFEVTGVAVRPPEGDGDGRTS
jgi:signal transduction histidine kinase